MYIKISIRGFKLDKQVRMGVTEHFILSLWSRSWIALGVGKTLCSGMLRNNPTFVIRRKGETITIIFGILLICIIVLSTTFFFISGISELRSRSIPISCIFSATPNYVYENIEISQPYENKTQPTFGVIKTAKMTKIICIGS